MVIVIDSAVFVYRWSAASASAAEQLIVGESAADDSHLSDTEQSGVEHLFTVNTRRVRHNLKL